VAYLTDDWHRCYGEGWQGIIVPEAFVHPAKFSRALIRRIYKHAFEKGWLKTSDTVLDPFGGVALGALEAMRRGLVWVGVELEDRFVQLGQANIDLWNQRYSKWMPGWGSAMIMRGDSRRLGEGLAQTSLCLSSPPYADTPIAHIGQSGIGTGCRTQQEIKQRRKELARQNSSYGRYSRNSANLGNLPDTGFEAAIAISSPPFEQSLTNKAHATSPTDLGLRADGTRRGGSIVTGDYGDTAGQLATMREGQPADAVISSPPYEASMSSETSGIDWSRCHREDGSPRDMSQEPAHTHRIGAGGEMRYSAAGDNLGNTTGDTFWSASRQILEQVYQVLVPGGHAIWVLRAFVRKGKLVDFPGQWRDLCEAVGFMTLHVHRAWLVEDGGQQYTLDGDLERYQVERKSFFRRLAECKGSPHVDYEVVLCTVRPY